MRISAENKEKAKKLVAQMTLEEKARLHAGNGAWRTESCERVGLGGVYMTDGPHGLRKEKDEKLPMTQENTVKSTCFPAAVSTSCSFDRKLLYQMGEAMADECLGEDVQIILGPAVNIKRSPLCGRNFEYVSEDPYLAGQFAASIVNGIQSKNVGTSVKHYLANSQETARLSSSSTVDERTLREIYLPAFETAVKEAQPYTIMCSYNRINGVFASVNKRMLTDILRDEWGFEGFVMSDWGAMDDRAESVRAGLDLEMPSRSKDFDLDIIEAVKGGTLDEALLDKCVERVVSVILQTAENKKKEYSKEKHHELARRIARESAVLLRNENGVLPLSKQAKIAVIGEFAEKPRYQGAGSSLIAPAMFTTPLDELNKQGIDYKYAKGYDVNSELTDEARLNEAMQLAASDDIEAIVAFVGLPDIYESEGYDRKAMYMPESHNRLIEELSKFGKPIVAFILAGSSVEIPWRTKTDAIMLMNLSGQNIGGAFYDLAFGDFSPCGKLAETYPLSLVDNPSYETFGGRNNVEYRESIFVGYRYYDTANRDVAYPFGFGLSYTSFEYKNARVSANRIKDTESVTVTVTVKNTGNCKAKEIVELYVKAPESAIFRACHELKGYEKIELCPGEEKDVEFKLSKRSFAYYNINISDWHVVSGDYEIQLAASSRDIRQTVNVYVESTVDAQVPDYRNYAPTYYNLPRTGELHIPHEQFRALFTSLEPFAERPKKPFTTNSTLRELLTDERGKILADHVIKKRLEQTGKDYLDDESYDAPMRSALFPVRGMTRENLYKMLNFVNGKTDKFE